MKLPSPRNRRAQVRTREPASRDRVAPESRTRAAGAAAAGTVGAGAVVLALVAIAVAVSIALLIGLAILLVDVNANAGNAVVKGIHEGADFFAGSFTGMIRYAGHPKRAISVNWGIAALVYLVVGATVAWIVHGAGRSGLRVQQRHRASAANY